MWALCISITREYTHCLLNICIGVWMDMLHVNRACMDQLLIRGDETFWFRSSHMHLLKLPTKTCKFSQKAAVSNLPFASCFTKHTQFLTHSWSSGMFSEVHVDLWCSDYKPIQKHSLEYMSCRNISTSRRRQWELERTIVTEKLILWGNRMEGVDGDIWRKKWGSKHFIETESRRKIQRNSEDFFHKSVEDLGNILFEVEICKGWYSQQ